MIEASNLFAAFFLIDPSTPLRSAQDDSREYRILRPCSGQVSNPDKNGAGKE